MTVWGKLLPLELSTQFRHQGEGLARSLGAYVISYDMQLWSNFTYFIDDPVNGDQFEQRDKRRILVAIEAELGSGTGQFRQNVGLEFRHDDIDEVGLYRTVARQRFATTRQDSVDQSSVALFYELAQSVSAGERRSACAVITIPSTLIQIPR